MAEGTSGTVAPGSVEALKRVKATESEWDARLTGARTEAETSVRRAKDETEAMVKAAQLESEHSRTVALERAQAVAQSEAETIVAEGRADAERAERGEGRRPSDKKDAILDIVLGSFGKD